ncbi:ImuA family protein [Mesorhizobium xinjiangense]|uniref:ImuA family protein n=1 Tax=Mesorhizobium xinjiangense TaxID=2678685 RepID=UPI0012ECD992|nr:hypothetical protein [Mesorhizobium xinjiangense]
MHEILSRLRASLAALEKAAPHAGNGLFGLGLPAVDAHLGGGLARGGLHEILAPATADAGSAAGFAAALALRATEPGRSIVWVRQGYGEAEAGSLHAPGLAGLGLDPDTLILVRVRDAVSALRAGAEAVRCSALGAVVIEPWGEAKALDFTASRRLALAAGRSGVTCLLLRMATAASSASAAATRWQVVAGASPPLAAGAPGHPTFDVTLLRQRAGTAGQSWRLEWNHDRRTFRDAAPLSRPVVPVPAGRPAGADVVALARTG